MFDFRTGEVVRQLTFDRRRRDPGSFTDGKLALSPDGKLIAIEFVDGPPTTVRLLAVDDGRAVFQCRIDSDHLRSIYFSDDGRTLFIIDERMVRHSYPVSPIEWGWDNLPRLLTAEERDRFEIGR